MPLSKTNNKPEAEPQERHREEPGGNLRDGIKDAPEEEAEEGALQTWSAGSPPPRSEPYKGPIALLNDVCRRNGLTAVYTMRGPLGFKNRQWQCILDVRERGLKCLSTFQPIQ
jgi:hypothetical protein